MTIEQKAEKYASDHCHQCTAEGRKLLYSCQCAELESAFIAGAASRESGCRWVRTDVRNPDVKGFYWITGLNNKGDITPPHEIWFSGSKWIVREGCKVLEWHESAAIPEEGDDAIAKDLVFELSIYLGGHLDPEKKPMTFTANLIINYILSQYKLVRK